MLVWPGFHGVWEMTWKSNVIPARYGWPEIDVCLRVYGAYRRQAASRMVFSAEMSRFFSTARASGLILLA
jgi:hypothetical protein